MNLTAAASLTTSFSASNSNGGRSQFELRVGPFVGNELTVVSFTGREALNEPFTYDVVFSSTLPEDALHIGTRGLPACLSIQAPAPHEPRVIQGLVVDFGATDTPTNELAAGAGRYFVRIAPRFWNLRNNSKRRVFQGKTAIEIVSAVMKDHDIEPDVQLRKGDYPPIPFEYQNKETDLDFIRRVLATAGVFFYFRHASGLLDALVPGGGIAAAEVGAAASAAAGLGGAIASASGFLSDAESTVGIVTTLVLADTAGATEQLGDTSVDLAKMGLDKAGGAASAQLTNALGSAGSAVGGVVGINTGASDPLVYDANGQAGYTDSERVFSFSLADPLVPKEVRLRHWNIGDATSFNATAKIAAVSADVTLNAIATVSLSQPANFGLNAQGAVDVDAPSIAPKEASVFEYDHDASLQTVPLANEAHMASRALTQARAERLPGSGTTDCRRIAPGYRFTLQNHPVAALNAEYLVTEIRCDAANADYATSANVRDYQCTFRCVPSRIDPLPKKPRPKEHAPEPAIVTGPKWGDIYCDEMERILVRFRWASGEAAGEGGDGSCRVHLLDAWGGDGYGIQAIPRVGTEVMVAFFDGGDPIAMGQIRSRQNRPAFRSPHEVTKVGIKSRVIPSGAESEISINDNPDRNEILLSSSGDLITTVEQSTQASHKGAYDLSIVGERREVSHDGAEFTFRKDRSVETFGDTYETAHRSRTTVVDGSDTRWVGGNVAKTVLGRATETTVGPSTATYEDDSLIEHLGHCTVVIAPPTADRQASGCVHVEGPISAYAAKKISLDSPEGITITCGDSCITIGKDSITLASPKISLVTQTLAAASQNTLQLSAKTVTVAALETVSVKGAQTASLVGQAASITLDSNATIVGTKVKLGSGSADGSSTAAAAKPATKTLLKLSDSEGNPIPNGRAILRFGGDSGTESGVVFDASGSFTVVGDDPVEITFPDVTLQDETRTVTGWRPYVIKPGDFLSALAVQYNFDAESAWTSDKNSALRSIRQSHHILLPGDLLFVPTCKKDFRPVNTGATNAFTARTVRTSTKLIFLDGRGTPLANAACTYRGLPPALDAKDMPSSTDGDGALSLRVPTTTDHFEVSFPDHFLRYRVFLGGIDPIVEVSGAHQRLKNLGYGTSSLLALGSARGHYESDSPRQRQRRLLAFQLDNKLPGTGQYDDETLTAIQEAHGS